MAGIGRGLTFVAGTVALVSAQAVSANSNPNAAPAIDPLVSVSVLGTPQSRAAICAANQIGSGCVLPGAASLATAAATAATTQTDSSTPPKSITWPLVIGLIAIIAVAALIFSSNGDGEGNLTPVSPA